MCSVRLVGYGKVRGGRSIAWALGGSSGGTSARRGGGSCRSSVGLQLSGKRWKRLSRQTRAKRGQRREGPRGDRWGGLGGTTDGFAARWRESNGSGGVRSARLLHGGRLTGQSNGT